MTVSVPKSGFYRCYMIFGIQNEVIVNTLGPLWFRQGHLGLTFGFVVVTNWVQTPKYHPKVLPKRHKSHKNVLLKSPKSTPNRYQNLRKIGGTREALRYYETLERSKLDLYSTPDNYRHSCFMIHRVKMVLRPSLLPKS